MLYEDNYWENMLDFCATGPIPSSTNPTIKLLNSGLPQRDSCPTMQLDLDLRVPATSCYSIGVA